MTAGTHRVLIVDLHVRALNKSGGKRRKRGAGENKQTEIPPHLVLSTQRQHAHPPGGWNDNNRKPADKSISPPALGCALHAQAAVALCVSRRDRLYSKGTRTADWDLTAALGSASLLRLDSTGEGTAAQGAEAACSWACGELWAQQGARSTHATTVQPQLIPPCTRAPLGCSALQSPWLCRQHPALRGCSPAPAPSTGTQHRAGRTQAVALLP